MGGKSGAVVLWNGQKEYDRELRGEVHGLVFASDGRHLATANGTIYIFRLSPPQEAQAKR